MCYSHEHVHLLFPILVAYPSLNCLFKLSLMTAMTDPRSPTRYLFSIAFDSRPALEVEICSAYLRCSLGNKIAPRFQDLQRRKIASSRATKPPGDIAKELLPKDAASWYPKKENTTTIFRAPSKLLNWICMLILLSLHHLGIMDYGLCGRKVKMFALNS